MIITGILKGHLLAAGLSHVEHLFIGGYLTIVKRWNLINSLWVSQFFPIFSFRKVKLVLFDIDNKQHPKEDTWLKRLN
jgi:hypothetical protein